MVRQLVLAYRQASGIKHLENGLQVMRPQCDQQITLSGYEGDKMGSDNPTLGANYCFGCGPLNPHGLHLKVQENDGVWEGSFVPQDYHCGWPGVVHGGVLSTALDEVMSYIAYGKGLMAVTARLTVEFKHPCAPGKPLLIRAWPVKVSRRIIETQAEIRLEDGTVAATATGKFLVLSEKQKKAFRGEQC